MPDNDDPLAETGVLGAADDSDKVSEPPLDASVSPAAFSEHERGLHPDDHSSRPSDHHTDRDTTSPLSTAVDIVGHGKDVDHEATPIAGPSFHRSFRQSKSKPTSIAALRAKVCKAAATGDLETLIRVLHPAQEEKKGEGEEEEDDADYPSSFALVNSPTASGLTPLLEAAQHGQLHVLKHLLEEEGAVRDLEDVEGENAFLKASYRGHLEIMKYLADGEDSTDINVSDREGWTAMHNAAGKGYLEIVMWLAEHGAVIDTRSRQGYTPLMNAASKGHLPIVRYFTARHSPDPLLRNVYGETAYDVAVATFELGIAEILAEQEMKAWQDTGSASPRSPYNPLAIHTNVPVILHENQRLDLRWQTRTRDALRAVADPSNSSRITQSSTPRIFTAAAISRRDGHASWELPSTYTGLNSSGRAIPCRRSDVHLPTILKPTCLPDVTLQPKTTGNDANLTPTQSMSRTTSAEAAWYWLSESFFVDLSPASVDPDTGWQYAKSFDTPNEDWVAEVPAELARILAGDPSAITTRSKWVRRRRWARVMRRKIGLPGFGQNSEGPELSEDDPKSTDYLERAKYFAGTHLGARKARQPLSEKQVESDSDTASITSHTTYIGEGGITAELDRAQGRRIIARLERAISELESGLAYETDSARFSESNYLLEIFAERLGELKIEYPGIAASDTESDTFQYPAGDDDTDDGASVSTSSRSVSIYSPALGSPPLGPSRDLEATVRASLGDHRPSLADLTAQLSNNPDFRVPTNEVPTPRKAVSNSSAPLQAFSAPQPVQARALWEADESAQDCRRCRRKFTFFLRKHHCRKCGLVVCGHCSSHNAFLAASEIVQEPNISDSWTAALHEHGGYHRVCDVCHQAIMSASAPAMLFSASGDHFATTQVSTSPLTTSAAVPPEEHEAGSSMQRSISDLSDLGECPVCGTDLHQISEKSEQEKHVNACLESGTAPQIQNNHYLVFMLPEESPLVGEDCLICFESYEVGDSVGRLSCFCHFHKHCISNWLSRGKACPVHAR